jgi:hypothetical protein
LAETGSSWKTFLVQFIPAILGSGLLVSTIVTSYSEFYNKPNIQVSIIRDDAEGTKTSVMLSNKGTEPATNLKLHGTMPYNITDIDIFSMENISVQNESKTFDVTMPRLVQGKGSVTTINLTAKPAEDNAYNSYSIYDQGSTKGKIYHSISEAERGGWSPVRIASYGLLITAFLVIYTIVLPRLLGLYYSREVTRSAQSTYSSYLYSNKTVENKASSLILLQREMTDLERRFSFRLLTKKTKDRLNKILTDNFKRILFDVEVFSTNADKAYLLGRIFSSEYV